VVAIWFIPPCDLGTAAVCQRVLKDSDGKRVYSTSTAHNNSNVSANVDRHL